MTASTVAERLGDSDNRSFLTSPRAASACRRELDRLNDELTRRLTELQVAESLEPFRSGASLDRWIVQWGPVSLSVVWLQTARDTVSGGELLVIAWRGTAGRRLSQTPERPDSGRLPSAIALREEVLAPIAPDEASWAWMPRSAGENGSLWSSAELAAVLRAAVALRIRSRHRRGAASELTLGGRPAAAITPPSGKQGYLPARDLTSRPARSSRRRDLALSTLCFRGFSVAPQFIYVMKALRKVVPPSRIILDDIWLSFYPGAKIGVLGANGAGKSSLLRIMAGVDQDFQGEAWAREGDEDRLPRRRSRSSTRRRTCAATSRRRSRRSARCSTSSTTICDAVRRADGRRRDDKLLDEQAKVQEQIDTHDLWNLDNKIEIAMDALRLPPGDADVTKLSGGEKRRVALCRVLLEQPDMLLLDEPTNHLDAESVAWLEQLPRRVPGTRRRDHARPLLPRQRRRSGSSSSIAGSGIPYEGNYTGWLEQKKHAPRAGGEDGVGAPAHACSASSSGCAWRRARGRRRARRASRSTRSWRSEDTAREGAAARDRHPAAAAARQRRRDREGAEEGVRRQAAVRRTCRSRCRAAASSASSGRTARARRRCSG